MEAQSPHITGTMHHPYDCGLGRGYAEVDIVSAVHGESKAGGDLVARDARMTKRGDLAYVPVEAESEPVGIDRVVAGNACANAGDVTLGWSRDDQGFGGNCSSPNRLMSARNSSALV